MTLCGHTRGFRFLQGTSDENGSLPRRRRIFLFHSLALQKWVKGPHRLVEECPLTFIQDRLQLVKSLITTCMPHPLTVPYPLYHATPTYSTPLYPYHTHSTTPHPLTTTMPHPLYHTTPTYGDFDLSFLAAVLREILDGSCRLFP